jgi:hypothetical protein
MNSLLQSSLFGKEFIRYRNNNPNNVRKKYSDNVINQNIEEIPIVIDSINEEISKLLAGPAAKRFNRNGMEYHFHKDLIIEDVLREVKLRLKEYKTIKVLKLGLENGLILKDKDIIGDLYKKYKDQKDNILYLLITEETTVYGYILSLLRYVFGESFMNS